MNNQKKKKLLFITYTHSNGGGAEKVLTTLVNNLDTKKYEIAIQEIVGFYVKQEPISSNIKLLTPLINGTHESRFNKHFTQYCIEKYPVLIRAIKSFDEYDVIVTWNYQIPSFMIQAFPDKKTISWFHTDIYDLSPKLMSLNDKYNLKLQDSAWNYADRIVTISNKSLQSLKDIFPQYLNKTKIIYNAFDIENAKVQASKVNINECMRYTYPILACVGRLEKRKNFSLVIQAAAKLQKENICCHVLIIGDGEEKGNLIRLVNELRMTEVVSFLGYKQNPLPYIQIADMLCISSFAEGFPTVVLEAMTLEKPFVTTPVAGASEELADNGNCGLVADWDVDDYAEKIKTLLTDKDLYDRMSKNCIKKIKEFSIENTVIRFDELVSSLPEKGNSGFRRIDKATAVKKIRRAYIWCPNFAIQRLRFSISTFFMKPSIRNFALTGYYFLRLLFYIPTLPIRFFTQPAILQRSENHFKDEKCLK